MEGLLPRGLGSTYLRLGTHHPSPVHPDCFDPASGGCRRRSQGGGRRRETDFGRGLRGREGTGGNFHNLPSVVPSVLPVFQESGTDGKVLPLYPSPTPSPHDPSPRPQHPCPIGSLVTRVTVFRPSERVSWVSEGELNRRTRKDDPVVPKSMCTTSPVTEPLRSLESPLLYLGPVGSSRLHLSLQNTDLTTLGSLGRRTDRPRGPCLSSPSRPV